MNFCQQPNMTTKIWNGNKRWQVWDSRECEQNDYDVLLLCTRSEKSEDLQWNQACLVYPIFWAQDMSFYSLVCESISQLSIYRKRTKPSYVATWTYWIYKTQQKAIARRIDTLWSYLWNWRTSGAMYDGVPQTVSTYSPGRTVLTLYARQKRCQVSKSSSIKINK